MVPVVVAAPATVVVAAVAAAATVVVSDGAVGTIPFPVFVCEGFFNSPIMLSSGNRIVERVYI